MRKLFNICVFVMLLSIPSCSTLQRPLTDAALGAGGATLGSALSHGNPAAIAGGAAGGVLLGEGINAWQTKKEKRAYDDGYSRGRSDGIKRLYWSIQDQQRSKESAESYRLYDIPIPEHWEDGVLVQPSTRVIRIEE